MGASDRAKQGDGDTTGVHRRAAKGEGVGLAVLPVLLAVGDRVARPRLAGEQIGRDEHLDTVLLGVDAVLGVGPGDKNTAVEKGDGLGVVEAGDGRVRQDGETRADRLGGVVQERVEVRVRGQAEASDAVVGTVGN